MTGSGRPTKWLARCEVMNDINEEIKYIIEQFICENETNSNYIGPTCALLGLGNTCILPTLHDCSKFAECLFASEQI